MNIKQRKKYRSVQFFEANLVMINLISDVLFKKMYS